jgi:hypothetical protein
MYKETAVAYYEALSHRSPQRDLKLGPPRYEAEYYPLDPGPSDERIASSVKRITNVSSNVGPSTQYF